MQLAWKKIRNSCKISEQKSEEKEPHSKPRYRQEDDNQINLKIWNEWM